jgi:hypothetical protein
MREIVAWVVPLLVSLFLIQSAAELLSMRAAAHHQATGGNAGKAKRETIRGPVHEVDRDVTASGIIT